MYKLARFLEWLAHFYISFLLRGKKVYLFVGLRRSGNHACINWLANSLDGLSSSFEESRQGNVLLSKSRRIIFFNEVNFWDLRYFITVIRKMALEIEKASIVFISLEDYVPIRYDPYIPKQAKRIAIIRSTLNLVASRVHYAIKQAKIGLDRGDMRIDEGFIAGAKWLRSVNCEEYKKWNYDKWFDDSDNYRARFLASVGLHANITPPMSTQGGGSSFSNSRLGSADNDPLSRWKEFDWPERIVNLLEENRSDLLTNTENEQFNVILARYGRKNKPVGDRQ